VRLPDGFRRWERSPSVTISARLFVDAHAREACSGLRCPTSSVRSCWPAAGRIDSVRTTRDTMLVLGVPLAIADDGTFELAIESRAAGYLSPDLPASLATRLSSTGFRKGCAWCRATATTRARRACRGRHGHGDGTRGHDPLGGARAGGFSAAVERRAAQGPGRSSNSARPAADGILRFVDRTVVARGEYEYRLTWVIASERTPANHSRSRCRRRSSSA